jgi:hypothetical protein
MSLNKIRKVLSFDVGIINLAYCLLEINDTEQTFKILKWGIIDLADNRNLCQYIKNTGEICNKVAKYALKMNQHNNHYYCKDHSKKASLLIEPINIKWYNVESDDVEHCKMCVKSGEYTCNKFDGQFCTTHQKTMNVSHKYICTTKKCNNLINQGLYLI